MINSNVHFKSCVFRDLSEDLPPENSGGWNLEIGALNVFGVNATLALDNCTLSNIKNPVAIAAVRGASVFSSNPPQAVRASESAHQSVVLHVRGCLLACFA